MKGLILANSSQFGMFRSLGAHRVASLLRSNGWDVEVIDFADSWPLEKLKELYNQRKTDLKFIGFSYIFSDSNAHDHVRAYCAWIKEQDSNLLLFGGGQVPSGCQDYFEYFIAGYGEVSILELLKYKFANGDKPKSTRYYNVEVIDSNADYPAYPISDPMVKYEHRDFIALGEWGQIELSRGCKFKCKFCSYPILGVKYDPCRTNESFREQLVHAHDNYGIENYLIVDETFNDHSEKITRFADQVETLSWSPYFSAYLRADLIISRPQDRENILRMGVYGHFHGIESFNDKTLKYIGKGMSAEKMQQGLLDNYEYFKQHSPNRYYKPVLNFVGGLPYETKESLEFTYNWLKNVWGMSRNCAATVYEISSTGDKFNQSDISIDAAAAGYSSIYEYVQGESVTSAVSKQLMWKTDDMDIRYAREWCDRVYNIHTLGNRNMKPLEPSDLVEILCEDNGSLVSLEKKLVLNDFTVGQYKRNARNIFLPNYIEKKLSV